MVAAITIHLQIETEGQSVVNVASTGPASSRFENGIRESIVARSPILMVRTAPKAEI